MSHIALTHTHGAAVRRRRSAAYPRELALGPVSLVTLTILIGFVLSLFYLSQSNRIATRGYEIVELQQEKSRLSNEHDQLQIQAARLQSIQTIKESVKGSGMVPVAKTSYLEGGE